jgi:multidrug efflux system membrane fusion protein
MEPDEMNAEQQSVSQTVTETQPPPQSHVSPPKGRRWIWTSILLVLAIMLVAAVYHHAIEAEARSPGLGMTEPVPVTPATAGVADMSVYLDAIGTVTPVYTDTITAQVTGVVTAVHYREGQFVRKGDPLIDLDSRPYEAQLEQAQGTLEHDQNLLAEAQMDFERYKESWGHNGISRQTLEDQEKLVLQYQGTVKYDLGTVHYDQAQVDYCHIKAPIDGQVGLRLVDPGNLITSNGSTTIVVITQMQPTTIVFTLAEDHLSEVLDQMRRGVRLRVEAWDREKHTQLATGQLNTIDNQIDTTTGTVKLRAAFDNHNGILFPNQFVNTRLLVKTLRSQVAVPSSAIQHNGDAAFVYLIQNGKAKMTSVTPGLSDGDMTAVEGIRPGDIIANSSFEKLQEGSKIAISAAEASSLNESTAP